MRQHTLKASTTMLFLAILVAVCTGQSASGGLVPTTVHLRSRVAVPEMPGGFRLACRTEQWNPSETAIIICDMWDRHWCQGASRRVAALAPQIARVASIARDNGVLIIHAPSDTIGQYGDHPGRRLAKDAPRAANLPRGLTGGATGRTTSREKRAIRSITPTAAATAGPAARNHSPGPDRSTVSRSRTRMPSAIPASRSGTCWNSGRSRMLF